MRIQITTRHCDVPDSIRARAEELLGRLTRYEPRASAAEVIFEEERRVKKVELIASVDGAPPAVAQGDGDDFRGALDAAVDRLQRILRRRHDQRKDHQAPPLNEAGRLGS